MRAYVKLAWAIMLTCLLVTFPVAAFAQATGTGSTVTVSIPTLINPILETVGGLLGVGAAASIIGLVVSFLPIWLRPLATAAVQNALSHFIEQGVNYAIQEVENFDKDKVVNFNVGSAGVATALRYVLNQAPPFLINLAGGKDKIVSYIVAFLSKFGIVLDSGVSPAQVESAAKSAV